MDFLFKDRGSGKRAIKPSKEAEHLEALIPEHESDDSDFELEKHKGENSDHESDSDGGKSATDDSSSSDSDDSGDSDNDSPNEDEVLRLKSNMTTQELISLAQRQSQTNTGSAAPQFSVKVCGTCLRSNSDHSNEIVECDSCGVSVHEACYGIQEGGSIASNASAASTEPWFCEPCMAGVYQPHCEVCPNIGGIYKETDVGNWVHLVCALYIPQISFFDPERITRATLFELNYQSWGKRACSLCKDLKFARTGLCIECDVGMCRQYFHVTCAQEAGLLSEPSAEDSEQFFGHCKAHSDKELIKKRKKNWLSHQLNYRQRGATIQAERALEGEAKKGKESASQRNNRKLKRCRERWVSAREGDSWVPTQKMPRLLLTSSKAIRKFQRKAELHEWNVEAMEEEEYNKQVVAEIRRKWHIQPAWTVEYVAYYHDRGVRIKEYQENLAGTVMLNNQLREEDDETCLQYRRMMADSDTGRVAGQEMKAKIQLYKDLLVKFDPLGRGMSRTKSPVKMTSPVIENHTTNTSSTTRRPKEKPISPRKARGAVCLHTCELCKLSSDQHLLAHCDVCKMHYHLGCMSPPLTKMPKKTKQWGWQCSECDKEPEMHPISYTPQIDIDAPRSSRNRGPPKANNLLCDSDVESAVIRDGPDIEFASETLKKHERKGIKASNLEKSEVKEDDKNTQPNDNTPSPAITSPPPTPAVKTPAKSGRKRGRPTTSSGKTENQENVSPPVKARRGRKPKASLTSASPSTPVSQPVTTVTVLEPVDSVVPPTDNGSSDPPKTPPHELPPNLPPKKLFKSKATLKEVSSPPNDSTNFKNWLDAKLSPTKPLSDPTSVPLPLPNGLGPDGKKHLNDELSRTEDTPEAAPTVIKVRLEPSGANCDASDDSSGDEASPDKSSSHASFQSEKDDRDVMKAEAKKERKRLKREEKEKRREERRKKKMMRTQEMEVDIVEDPDIEEDEDCCVVRIAPKPIKIKIKPITKPPDESPAPAPDFAIVTEEATPQQKPEQNNISVPPNHVNNRPPTSPVTHMHPKKKIAHMDSLVNNYPIVNNLIHSTLNTFPTQPLTINLPNKPSESTNSSSASSLSSSVSRSTTPTQNMIPTKSSSTPPLITTINLKGGSSPAIQPATARNGVADRQYSTDVEILDNEDPSSSPNHQDSTSEQQTPPSSRERPKRTPNGENAVRRGRDARTKCDVCLGEGNNGNLVRCDECLRCYHFGCLNPPVKKTPKVSGWAWSCSECVPSDEDKGWHL